MGSSTRASWDRPRCSFLGRGRHPPRGVCVCKAAVGSPEKVIYFHVVSAIPVPTSALPIPTDSPMAEPTKSVTKERWRAVRRQGLKAKASCSGQHGKGLLHPLPAPPGPLLPTRAACVPCQEHPSVSHHQDSGCSLSKIPGKRVLAGTALMPAASPGPVPREP